MLYAVLTLIALQFLGDLIASATALSIPGMVIGLMLLLCALAIRSWWLGSECAVPDELNSAAGTLHSHFGLLFVPAGVGVMANIDLLAANGLVLLVAVLLSTVATIAVTATVAALRPKVVGSPEVISAE